MTLAALLLSLFPKAQESAIKFNLVEGIGEISLGKITGITQDAYGYMWFSDQDKACITRYDGYTMHSYRYDPSDPGGLGGSYPETIYADPGGFLWIGFYGMGLDRFDPRTEQFIHYRYHVGDEDGLSSDTVNVLTMDASGNLWIGTNGGIDVLDPIKSTWRHFRHSSYNPASLDNDIVRSLCIDRQGTVWAGTGFMWDHNETGGLNRLDAKTKTFTHLLKNQRTRSIFEDSKAVLWAGTEANKLYSIDKINNKLLQHPVMPAPASPFDHITFIKEDASGQLWIGTLESGIVRYDPVSGTTTQYGDGAGMADNSGWQAYASREGALWFSTQSANLYRIDPTSKPYHFYPAKAGVFGFAEISKDHLWLATNQGVVYLKPWAKPTYMGIADERANNVVPVRPSQFLPDSMGKQMLISNGSLFRIDADNKNLHVLPTGPGLIRYAIPTDKAHLLLATNSGLYKFDLNNGRKEKVSGAASDINVLYLDRKKTLWAGHSNNNGLSHTNADGQVVMWLKGHTITCLYEDSKNNFWAGTPGGVWVKQHGYNAFSLLKIKNSPIGNAAIIGIAEDDSGYVWISSRSGIFQLNPLNSQVKLYGMNHGVNNSILTGAIFRKQSGEILVGSEAGYYSFDPRSTALQSPPPQIIMREFKVSGKLLIAVDSGSAVRLRHDQNIFSIGFAGIHFSNPGENIHLYKLENYDSDWRNAGAERTAYYYNIPPGKYVFHVRVGNNEDVWAEKTLSIEIVPAWWTNSWFIVFSGLVIAGLLYATVRTRFRMQLRRQTEKARIDQQLAELQRRSSELEMQALRSQMNPHFIFNALNAINRFILQDNSDQASGYLTKFSRLIRFILQNSEQPLISLERELNTLELYLELEALRFDYHFSYSIKINPGTDTTSLQVPPLIIQPYAENAIWHGLMHKKTPGHLEISLHCDPDWLYCVIKDDGIGRVRAGELKSKSANQHKSMGMKITAGRMEILKKENRYTSAITICDPVNKDGSSAGTEVILKIPLKYD